MARQYVENWYTTYMILNKLQDLRTEQKTGRLICLPKRDSSMLKRRDNDHHNNSSSFLE